MSKNKNKAKPEAVEVKDAEVEATSEETLAPKLSTYIAYAVKKLSEREEGHREIDIAAKDAIESLNKAIDLVKFIENI